MTRPAEVQGRKLLSFCRCQEFGQKANLASDWLSRKQRTNQEPSKLFDPTLDMNYNSQVFASERREKCRARQELCRDGEQHQADAQYFGRKRAQPLG